MDFMEFIHRLGSVIKGKNNTSSFTQSVFEAVVSEDALSIVTSYSASSFKAFYNGKSSITSIAQGISAYTDSMNFSSFIHSHPDTAVENICKRFIDVLPSINPHNAGDCLADLFISIITDAASATRKVAPKKPILTDVFPPTIISNDAIAPDLATVKDGVLYLQRYSSEDEEKHPLQEYLNTATRFYSTKKTLLYAEKPHPFYELYVCNDVKFKNNKFSEYNDPHSDITIHEASIQKLEAESNYIIIEGLGGIGKSMLLTHLFLSASSDSHRIPLLLFLKDYRNDTSGIVDFIWKSAKDFDPQIKQSEIVSSLQDKELVLLLDGLDEIQSSAREAFQTDLEAFIKSYPGNMVIITSRPVNNFVAYSKFTVFDIEPLTKEQSLSLIDKLEFWDTTAKKNFMNALDRTLYYTHKEFASNPLLLTIMLMTYSSFGEVPAKMHVFYSKAYETMARLHDATKGSYKRPLYTGLTPEEFAKYFAEFCARTYKDEILEFNELSFSSYMSKVLHNTRAEEEYIEPYDFLLDLTDNLCIMYREGDKFYFIHRSFQEYFAAVHFATGYDYKLSKVGNFFEKIQHRSYTDRTFDMLYDMIPDKVERYIFLPYLQDLFSKCTASNTSNEYWEFLNILYPFLYYQEGEYCEPTYSDDATSFIYRSIVEIKNLKEYANYDQLPWPKQIYDLPTREYVRVYSRFLNEDVYSEISNTNDIDQQLLKETAFAPTDELPYQYETLFGTPEKVGKTIEIEIYNLKQNASRYVDIRYFMEQEDFPLHKEFESVKNYYIKLSESIKMDDESDELFDD